MTRILHHTLPNTPGAGQLPTGRFRQLDTYQHEQLSQPALDPFAVQAAPKPFVLDKEMLVPSTASLYSPASDSIGDIVGRAAAPYFDAIHGSVRKLLRRDPPRIYTALPTEKPLTIPAPDIFTPAQKTRTQLATLAAATAGAGMLIGCDGQLADALTNAIGFKLVGGFGLFMVGLDLMKKGLDSVSGNALKTIISKATGNRFTAFGVGLGATTLVQSSSVTTIMSLGLVDAGLMTLYSSMGVIVGANIGTTITGWLFALKVAKYGLPMIGASTIPFVYSKNDKVKNIARATLGLGMVFLGLTTMSSGFKDPAIKAEITSLFSTLTDPSRLGILKCIIAGAITTAVVQSSSATVGITIALAKAGVLPFPAAAGLVMGENIGTTVTAGFAAMKPGTRRSARQVALAHFLFNAVGVGAAWAAAPQFIGLIAHTADQLGIKDPGARVAFAHTFYNVAAASVFLALLPQFRNMVERLTPGKEGVKPEDEWSLGTAADLAPGAALLQSRGKIKLAHGRVNDMFTDIHEFQHGRQKVADVEAMIRSGEADLDTAQTSILAHLNRVERSPLSEADSFALGSQRRVTGELESVSDHLLKLMLTYSRGVPAAFPQEGLQLLTEFHRKTLQLFVEASDGVQKGKKNAFRDIKPAYDHLKDFLAQHRGDFVITPGEGVSAEEAAEAQVFFTDIVRLYDDILGNVRNIAETAGKKK